jgi:hypothetical protein
LKLEKYKRPVTRIKQKQHEKIGETSSVKEEKDQTMADKEEIKQDPPENCE